MKAKTHIDVAVFGAGAIGVEHIAGFRKHPAARVAAVADTSEDRAREAADRFGIPHVATDYRELLRRPGIDAVGIALPTWLHAPAALDALRAGKHVLLEKPMALDAGEAARVVAAAKRHRRHLMVGQNQRFGAAAQTVRRLVAEGRLGHVYHARATWLRRSGIPRIGSWFTQRRFAGGGCTADIGVHLIDLALHLMDDFRPAAVSAQTFAEFGPRGRGDGAWGRSEIHPGKPFDVEDFSVALVKMKSGRTVLLEVSWAAAVEHPDQTGIHLFGSEAGASTNPLRLFRPGPSGFESIQIPARTDAVPDDRMVHFIDVVLGRAQTHVPPAESLVVQRVLDAVYASARTGREVRLR
jgi:predicted dehydrogenase